MDQFSSLNRVRVSPQTRFNFLFGLSNRGNVGRYCSSRKNSDHSFCVRLRPAVLPAISVNSSRRALQLSHDRSRFVVAMGWWASQSRTTPSEPPVATNLPLGLNATV